MAGTELVLGLVGGGGVASIAAVIQNARANKTTTKIESNKNAIDGFDRLTARLETRVANAEAAELEAVKAKADAEAAFVVKLAEKDAEIADLRRKLEAQK